MAKNLQLYRNTTPFENKEMAVSALQSRLKMSADGEIVLARFYTSQEGDPRPVSTIFGIAYDADRSTETNNAQYTIFDNTNGITSANINGIDAVVNDGRMTVVVPAKNINLSEYEAIDLGTLGSEKLTSIVANDNLNVGLNSVENNLKKIVAAINNKVEKVVGKSLISDDEINRLKGVKNYDDTEINSEITALKEKTAANAAKIQENTTAIGTKIDTSVANGKFALKTELTDGLAKKVNVVVGQRLITNEEGQQINTNKDNISALQSSIANKAENSTVSELSTKVNGIDSRVSENNSQITSLKTSKQDTLVSGENIATINGADLTNGGNITISGGDPTPVVDNLESYSTTSALSANQGRVLDGKITELKGQFLTQENIVTSLGEGPGSDNKVMSEKLIKATYSTKNINGGEF